MSFPWSEREITPTTSKDIKKFTNGKAKIMLYSDLSNYNSLEDAMDGYDAIVLLYLTSNEFGHWCSVFKYPNGGYEFFDSYGLIIDDELKFTPKQFRLENGQYYPQLTYLLYKLSSSGNHINYNEYKFQGKKTSTCGLWVSLRLKNKDMSLEEFKTIFLDLPKSYNIYPDEMVSYLFLKD